MSKKFPHSYLMILSLEPELLNDWDGENSGLLANFWVTNIKTGEWGLVHTNKNENLFLVLREPQFKKLIHKLTPKNGEKTDTNGDSTHIQL